MGFNEFLHRCELLDFDFDPKLVAQGRMHTRDMHKLKVCSAAGPHCTAPHTQCWNDDRQEGQP